MMGRTLFFRTRRRFRWFTTVYKGKEGTRRTKARTRSAKRAQRGRGLPGNQGQRVAPQGAPRALARRQRRVAAPLGAAAGLQRAGLALHRRRRLLDR